MTPEQFLGRYLRDLRISHGLTLEELAKKLGMSRSYLNQIELGNRMGSIKILTKLASFFNLSLGEILDYSGYSETAEK